MRGLLAGAHMQLRRSVKSPDQMQVFWTSPFFTILLFGIVFSSNRADLAPYALVASTVMSLWTFCIGLSGQIMTEEKRTGNMELLISAPVSIPMVLMGRVATITLIGTFTVFENVAVAFLLFDVRIDLYHPWMFSVGLITTVFSMACTSVLISSWFVLARNGGIFASFLTYPIYIISGLMVPVALLPLWIQGVSKIVFLSWGVSLMRESFVSDSLTTGDLLLHVAMIVVLGGLSLAAGVFLTKLTVRRLTTVGEASYA